MNAAEWFVTLLTAYAAIGIAFGILFVLSGVQRIDPGAKGAGAGFRLLILPGVAALWPVMLLRWVALGGSS
jgi:hypothetical protein